MRMMLYDCNDGRAIENIPPLIYRGFPLNKSKNDTFSQLSDFFDNGGVKSKVLLIKEGKFDLKKTNLNKYCFYEPGTIENKFIPKYLSSMEKGYLEPFDIDDDLRILHVTLNLPTHLVSATTEAFKAANYSRWVKYPVLVFKTENLEGVDFRTDERDVDDEIGIFRMIPSGNLVQIFYFYENPKSLRKILKAHGREDVMLEKGYVRPGFSYISYSGKKILARLLICIGIITFMIFIKAKKKLY